MFVIGYIYIVKFEWIEEYKFKRERFSYIYIPYISLNFNLKMTIRLKIGPIQKKIIFLIKVDEDFFFLI